MIKRKPGRPKGPPTQPVSIRLTKPQHTAYIERGGARWLKRIIDELIAKPKCCEGGPQWGHAWDCKKCPD